MKSHDITHVPFGTTTDGQQVDLYTLVNSHGWIARIATLGAMLTELHVPDRHGEFGDVVLGFDSLAPYLKGHPYFGSTTGRVANRIARGRFPLNGREILLATNNGPNHLHGGLVGFDKRVWHATPGSDPEGPRLSLAYLSPDGEEGYPGALDVTVTYVLTHANELKILYSATTDRTTPVNLTNHAYFNLKDCGATPILDHVLQLNADRFTPVDTTSIPTGEILAVKGTPMDFLTPTPIGARIGQMTGSPGGYDHNYVLNKRAPDSLTMAARVTEPTSGRVMEIATTEPGIQFYTGNYLEGTLVGKGGKVYAARHGFCLETQHFPDAVNHPAFPSILLNPGERYAHATVHAFSTV